MALVPILLFFDPAAESEKKPALKKQVNINPKKEKRLFCAACRHPITHQDERIPVQGGHEHRFTNPHGITYHIGCYREAAGCSVVGESTAEFTWFPGYAWRIALCANCQTHLGWRFQTAGEYFHGLILNRLTSIGRVSH
ncbi:MAG TPA: cereblon family protein [Sulfuricaulis sp.]|nr:cereblon family protein [Sulfuricaulis sp.]